MVQHTTGEGHGAPRTASQSTLNQAAKNTMNHVSNTIGLRSAAMTAAVKSLLPHSVALLCTFSAIGCLAPDGDTEESVGSVQSSALTNNALTNNALTNNALSDESARAVLQYVVSCALPAGQQVDVTVDGVAYSYPGELGLAPQWGLTSGTCNTSCQEWVSACVMARVDYLGAKVLISMRGATPALTASNTEIANYTVAEGAYYGNIFLATPERNACIAPGRSGLPRVCGPTTAGCVVDAIGYCDDTCDKADKKNGFFPNCRDNVKDGTDHYPAGTKAYAATATVFLIGT